MRRNGGPAVGGGDHIILFVGQLWLFVRAEGRVFVLCCNGLQKTTATNGIKFVYTPGPWF